MIDGESLCGFCGNEISNHREDCEETARVPRTRAVGAGGRYTARTSCSPLLICSAPTAAIQRQRGHYTRPCRLSTPKGRE